jgi:hypothetical protein
MKKISRIYSIKELSEMNHLDARQQAKRQKIPRANHVKYGELTDVPQCSTSGCTNNRIVYDWHWITGAPVFRKVCRSCHDHNTAKRYAAKTPGAGWVKTVNDVVAHKAGFSNFQLYYNSRHPYLKYRKDYCENQDGRLGYKCTAKIVWDGQLDVDHVNENPGDNRKRNLQTLCKCCHAYKGHLFIKKHGRTPGRKTLGIKY